MVDAMMPERSAGTRSVPISVIIPSYGRAALLRETVQSVLAAEERPAEIVIIDQSPEPDRWLLQLAPQDCEIRYVLSTEVGASLARNRGARLARFPILAFIDDDVRVRPDWVRACLDSARAAGRRTVLTGRVLPGESGAPGGFVPSTIDSELPVTYEGRIAADVLFTNNMVIHRAFFDDVGGFDERLGGGTPFPAAEDNDFAHRVLELGGRILYVPGIVIVHRAWRTAADYLPLRWAYGRGQGAFYGKHLSIRDRYMLNRLRYDATQRVLRFFRYAPRQPRRAVGQLVFLGGLLTGAAQWILTRRKA